METIENADIEPDRYETAKAIGDVIHGHGEAMIDLWIKMSRA